MGMSKKHYEMIANAFSGMSGDILISKKILINRLCRAFENDNDRFDEWTFKDACVSHWKTDEDALTKHFLMEIKRD
tara:strand:+ start:307 stop:534 length:228 start_codon:yes stop_codon:yes gene_type:complete